VKKREPEKEHPTRPHEWEIVKMVSGKVRRCSECWQAYEFGFDLPCPAKKDGG